MNYLNVFLIFIIQLQVGLCNEHHSRHHHHLNDERLKRIDDKNDANHYKTIKEIWLSHNHPFALDKWSQYGDAYEKHLPRPVFNGKEGNEQVKRKEIRLLEIGVQSGGSLIDWKRYYGDNSVIVGIDIDPRCMRSHMPEEKIFVEIGSQMDESFLFKVCEKYGPFDAIIDDGGHSAKMIKTSITAMFRNDSCLSLDSGDAVYAIEDLHTTVMRYYFKSHKEFTHDILAEAFRSLHVFYANKPIDGYASPIFEEKITNIFIYDSVTLFVKGTRPSTIGRINRGRNSFPNEETKYNHKDAYYTKWD